MGGRDFSEALRKIRENGGGASIGCYITDIEEICKHIA